MIVERGSPRGLRDWDKKYFHRLNQPGFFLILVTSIALIPAPSVLRADSELGPSDVLILVNADSPVSRSVADLYRRYYPEIPTERVLYLTGLPDSASLAAGPEHEIITRDDFENLIAQPVRGYLIANDLVNSIYCIITTAGMPYRIEDTDPALADVVKPAASNADLTVQNRNLVNAASVESELAVLFQIDEAIVNTSAKLPIENRVVNPYQGYRSGIKSWPDIRDILTRRETFRWTYIRYGVSKGPRIEGEWSSPGLSSNNRIMSPADIYLVARLDGPHVPGKYPIFAVKDMLDRAAAVGDPNVGYNPVTSAMVIDAAPGAAPISYTKTFNLAPQYDYLEYEFDPIPPGAEMFQLWHDIYGIWQYNEYDHYIRTYQYLTGSDPPADQMITQPFTFGIGGTIFWDDTNAIMKSSYLPADTGLIGLLTYGRNGGDGRPVNYLMTGGPGGGPLFKCAPGAVFASLESFNAVTMFTDVWTCQGKIAEFIKMGGTAAVGHSFEPEVTASIQGEFLFANLLRDEDANGISDLTFIEAVFSAMPYLSWSEVVIGDPLMRFHAGPGGLVDIEGCPQDVTGDGLVTFWDFVDVLESLFTRIGNPDYDPATDVTQDGVVTGPDLGFVKQYYNTACYEGY